MPKRDSDGPAAEAPDGTPEAPESDEATSLDPEARRSRRRAALRDD